MSTIPAASIREEFEAFNVEDYVKVLQHLPDDVREPLTLRLQQKQLGWQVRAKWVIRLQRASEDYQTAVNALIEKTRMPRKPRGTMGHIQNMTPREALAESLNKMSDAQLQEVAATVNVSYESFMNTHDKGGLIESILDEMLKS